MILGISGSLRHGSSNTALLFAAKALAAPFTSIEVCRSLGDLPHFNPDLDRNEPPNVIADFRRTVRDAGAILISTPEYAHGVPGVLKNALDWLVSDVHFSGKPVGIFFGSTSDSSFARTALIEVLDTMSARVISEAVVSIPGAREKVGSDGRLQDEQTTANVLKAIGALSEIEKAQK